MVAILDIYPRETKTSLNTDTYSRFIGNSQKLETSQMSFHGREAHQTVRYMVQSITWSRRVTLGLHIDVGGLSRR